MTVAVQLAFEVEGLDPYELAALSLFERIALYEDLELCPLQRECAEAAVRRVRARTYRRAGR